MEGRTVVTVFLTGLIIPIGLVAAVLGILTIVKGMGGFGNPRHSDVADKQELAASGRLGSSLLERVAAGFCLTAAVALVLVLGVNVGRSGRASPWTAFLLLMILLLPAPTILWNTRYRVASEGIATIAIAVIAILAGFSIGFLFVPIVVLMIWLCINQLRSSNHSWKSDRPRVDSST
jgi:hypothetical protein